MEETRGLLRAYEEVTREMSADGLSAEESEKLSKRMDELQSAIEAKNGWWVRAGRRTGSS